MNYVITPASKEVVLGQESYTAMFEYTIEKIVMIIYKILIKIIY